MTLSLGVHPHMGSAPQGMRQLVQMALDGTEAGACAAVDSALADLQIGTRTALVHYLLLTDDLRALQAVKDSLRLGVEWETGVSFALARGSMPDPLFDAVMDHIDSLPAKERKRILSIGHTLTRAGESKATVSTPLELLLVAAQCSDAATFHRTKRLLAAGATPKPDYHLAALFGRSNSLSTDDKVLAAARGASRVPRGTPTYREAEEARTPILRLVPLLHHVAVHHTPAVLKLLLDAGANPDTQDANGRTALHLVCWPSHYRRQTESVIRVLLDGGADPSLRDEDGAGAMNVLPGVVKGLFAAHQHCKGPCRCREAESMVLLAICLRVMHHLILYADRDPAGFPVGVTLEDVAPMLAEAVSFGLTASCRAVMMVLQRCMSGYSEVCFRLLKLTWGYLIKAAISHGDIPSSDPCCARLVKISVACGFLRLGLLSWQALQFDATVINAAAGCLQPSTTAQLIVLGAHTRGLPAAAGKMQTLLCGAALSLQTAVSNGLHAICRSWEDLPLPFHTNLSSLPPLSVQLLDTVAAADRVVRVLLRAGLPADDLRVDDPTPTLLFSATAASRKTLSLFLPADPAAPLAASAGTHVPLRVPLVLTKRPVALVKVFVAIFDTDTGWRYPRGNLGLARRDQALRVLLACAGQVGDQRAFANTAISVASLSPKSPARRFLREKATGLKGQKVDTLHPLELAAAVGDFRCIQALLLAGADPKQAPHVGTLLVSWHAASTDTGLRASVSPHPSRQEWRDFLTQLRCGEVKIQTLGGLVAGHASATKEAASPLPPLPALFSAADSDDQLEKDEAAWVFPWVRAEDQGRTQEHMRRFMLDMAGDRPYYAAFEASGSALCGNVNLRRRCEQWEEEEARIQRRGAASGRK